MILALQTTTFGVLGGIPTYNRIVCRTLDGFNSAQTKAVLIATDTVADLASRHAELPSLRLKAFSRERNAFARSVLRSGLSDRIDLALIGHVNYAPLGWMLKKLQPQMRYGVMLYGIDAWQPLSALKRRALQQADFIISISDYTRQRAIETNDLAGKRIDLLPNALEWDEVEPADSTKPTIQGTCLLSVCRLEQSEKYKGVDKVIESLPEVARRVPDIQYLIVGGGSDLDRHRQLAVEKGVAERVHFLGFLPEQELRACYRDCQLFVMPSAGEGFGFVFLEAMKYGKAIVAAKSGGAPEVVIDGVTGKLVEYGSKAELTAALIDLSLDKSKCDRLGQAGYQRLQEKFLYPRFEQTLSEILLRQLSASACYRGRREILNHA